jgi:hypothetical protein
MAVKAGLSTQAAKAFEQKCPINQRMIIINQIDSRERNKGPLEHYAS